MATEIDTRGKLCPLPLIMLKQGLEAHPDESNFVVLTDNQTSCGNLKDFILDHGFTYTEEQKSDVTLLTVQVTPGQRPKPTTAPKKERRRVNEGTVVQLGSNRMGEGADELGDVLMLAFLNALLGSQQLPKEIICYNSGVLLALKGTPTAEKLMELERNGVRIILCGTCVDYFGVKSELALGHITNMLAIYEHLSEANQIIKP